MMAVTLSLHFTQIRRDGAGSRRGRRTEELIAQSGALALVTNLVMAWNTHHM